MAKHISRNHFVDISITLGQKRLFRQIDYNLFAKVAILPKGYYFCAKGEAEGDEQDSLEHFYDRSRVLGVKLHIKVVVLASSSILCKIHTTKIF